MNEKPNVTTNRINYRSSCHDIEKHPAAASLSRHRKSSRINTLLIIAILSAMAISITALAVLFHIQRIELVQIRREIGHIANKIDKHQESREDTSTNKRKYQPMIATSSKPVLDVATPTSTQESSQTPSENATFTPTESLNTKLNSSTKETVEKITGSYGSTISTIQKQKTTPTPYEYFKIRTKDKILVYVTRIDKKMNDLDNKITKLHSYVKRNVRKLIRLHEKSNGKPNNNKDKDTDKDKDKDEKNDKISGSDFLDLLNKNSKLKDKD